MIPRTKSANIRANNNIPVKYYLDSDNNIQKEHIFSGSILHDYLY